MSTMRDRNRLLTRVLDTKGWNTYRIWSLAYFENKTKILSELKAYLDRLVEAYEVPATEAREVEVSARVEPARTVREIEEVRIVPQREEAVSLSIGYTEAGRELQITSGTDSYTGAKVADRVRDKEVSTSQTYEQLRIDPNLFGNFDISDYRRYEGTPLFRDKSITEVNSRQIAFLAGEIISIEAPIVEELLVRRIMEQFKDAKTTTNMKMIVTQALEEMKGKKLKEKGAPVYFGHISPKEYEGSRNPSEDYRRDIDMIPLCELANRMFFIAWKNQKNLVVLLEEGDLIKETVKSFGFSRTTAKMADRLAEALKSLILKKRLRRSGGRLEFVAEGL